MRHYRVDKMDGLAVLSQPREGDGSGRAFDAAAYGQKHFGMFGGREGMVRLRCEKGLVGVVLDRFGGESLLIPDGEDHFTVTVPVVVSPQFMGWIFGLGTGVELTGPDWAVEAYRRQLEQVGARYR